MMERPKPGRSARWGAACTLCAAAKTRCIRTQSSGSLRCDRCRSLEKDCVGQISGPRKKRQAKPSPRAHETTTLLGEGPRNLIDPSKTPEGQNSVDNLTSTSVNLRAQGSHNSTSSISIESQARFTPSQDESAQNSPAHDFTGAPKDANCTCMATVDSQDLHPVETDESLLRIYSNQLSASFPFVIIPAGTTPRHLQATRPFLMKVIRMVASVRHLRLVRGQGRAVMEHVSNAMLMRSERSLDLLQGIIVFLGSYHYHCMAHAQLNNLIRLAVSLVEDMDLNTCPKSQQRRRQLPLVRAEELVPRTNEEKRALLGVWYMSSNAGLVVKQLASTRYTKYMDQCLKDLSDAREHQTDQLLIYLIHIQRITEKTFLFHSNDESVDEKLEFLAPAMMASLEGFRVELDSLRNTLPSSLKSDHFLSCYHSSAYLRIYEPLLAGSNLPDADSQSFASLSRSGVLISGVFSDFTTALKIWLKNWLAIPVCSYFYMPQPAYIQLVYGAMMLSRWVRLAGPSAIQTSGSGINILHKASPHFLRAPPALSGVPACPNLGLPKPPALSISTQVASIQIINTLRTEIDAQPHLQIDVLGILDIMAARFEAAKKEMNAAQGLDWENVMWDLAAEHLRMKKARVEKWCEAVAIAPHEGRTPPFHAYDNYNEANSKVADMFSGKVSDDPQWLTSAYDWDIMDWESNLFDDIFQDIHTGAFV
ncbi:hypothetical protein VTL71DRAFT_13160 [Oculimacula yallundae]|uniref:Zn(2)-C6 fungal-type domain-containing protein n=1 Tax=Oculimacula yallundae TaxID=86028 RepID=A0ABR4CPR6_9HELO